MEICDQIADEVLDGDKRVRKEIPADLLEILRERISAAVKSDRARAARILKMAPLEMSLEQLACLIEGG